MSEGSPKEEPKEEVSTHFSNQPPEPKIEDNKPGSSFTIDVLINLNNENESAMENVPVELIKAEVKLEKVEDVKPEIKTEPDEPQNRNLFETVGLVLEDTGEASSDDHVPDNAVISGDLSELNNSDAPTVTPVAKSDVIVTDPAMPQAQEYEDMETEPAIDPDAPTVTLVPDTPILCEDAKLPTVTLVTETPMICEDANLPSSVTLDEGADLPTDSEEDEDDEEEEEEDDEDEDDPSVDHRSDADIMNVNEFPNPKFICQFCEFSAPTFVILQKHLKYHTNKNKAKQQCMICGWWYQEFKPLTDHFLNNHNVTEDQLMKCDHCQFVTLQKTSLDDHVKKHFVKKPFACQLCYMSFASYNGCTKHINNHHSKEEHLKIGFVEKKPGKRGKDKSPRTRRPKGRNKNAKNMTFYSKLYKEKREKSSKIDLKSRGKIFQNKSGGQSTIFPVNTIHLDCSFCETSVETKSELAQHLINTHPHEKFPIFGKVESM